jgi:hypothetical protein
LENLQRDVVLILGQTGSGKTTWARDFIKTLPRVMIADADFHEYGALDFDSFDTFLGYLEPRAKTHSLFRISYTPYIDEYPLIFDAARLSGPCHLVLEEADRFDDPRYCPEYEEIIGRGRHHRISIVAVSRYPFALPSMLRREATRIIAFHHHEPSDMAWFYEVMGPDSAKLSELKEHEFIDWRPGLPSGDLHAQKLNLTGSAHESRIIPVVK